MEEISYCLKKRGYPDNYPQISTNYPQNAMELWKTLWKNSVQLRDKTQNANESQQTLWAKKEINIRLFGTQNSLVFGHGYIDSSKSGKVIKGWHEEELFCAFYEKNRKSLPA